MPKRLASARLTGILLIVLALCIGLDTRSTSAEAAPSTDGAVPRLAVDVTRLRMVDHYVSLRRFSGQVAPRREVALAFLEAGRLTELLVEEGTLATAGEVVARLDTDLLRAERDRLVALLAAMRAERDILAASADRELGLANQGLASARSRDGTLIQLGQSESRIADFEGQLRQLDIRLRRSILEMPFDGHVASLQAEIGSSVGPGHPVLTAVSDAAHRVRIAVDADLADGFAPGMVTDLHINARTVRARVVTRLPGLDRSGLGRPILFEIDGRSEVVAGAVATLSVAQRQEATGAWVPIAALRDGLRGLWEILVVVPDGTAHRVAVEAVEVLHADEDRAFIRGSFADGALLVRSGQHRLTPGQTVRLAE